MVINYLMVTSASRELAPCCRALLNDIMVFSGASCSKEGYSQSLKLCKKQGDNKIHAFLVTLMIYYTIVISVHYLSVLLLH